MATRVRRATRHDAEQVAEVILAAFRHLEPLYTPAGFSATTPRASEIARRLDEGPSWIASESTTIMGTVSALARDREIPAMGTPHSSG